MKNTKHTILKSLTAFALVGTMLGSGIAKAEENAAEADGSEVQTRGPIHEAFAGTVSYNPEVGLIVDQKPPALIEEVPPEQRLEGDNVTWIPGYWAWDEDQNDFLWVSGIWRNLPPGRQWVPGYWAENEGRHQWTSGYWEDEAATEVSYLPKPPKSVEEGPNVKAPSDDHSWVPGNWIWRNDRYAWRTGYWAPARENWSWTPAYYRWSHRGYVYVDGFWDYPVIRRGVVFAPVHFARGYAFRPGYSYRPATVISLSVFSNHLFLRPGYGHYYFGDYYEPRYRDRGFFASYSYGSGHRGFDPIFAHYRWENRGVAGWERGRRDYFEFRRDHVEARPPRTWAVLNSRPVGDRERGDFGVAERFDRVVDKHGEGQQHFKAVDQQEHDRFVSQNQDIRKFGQNREQTETKGDKVGSQNGDKHPEIAREKIDHSPVSGKHPDENDKDGPPARLQGRGSEKDDKGPKADKQDPADPAKTKDGGGAKDNGGTTKDKVEPTPEKRTKPGQKRDVEPTPDHKMKTDGTGDATPDTEKKVKTGKNSDTNPSAEDNGKPDKKQVTEPDPVHKVKVKPDTSGDSNPPAHKAVKDNTSTDQPKHVEKKPKKAPVEEPQRRVAPTEPQPRAHPKQNQTQPVAPTDGTTEDTKKHKGKKNNQ